MAINFKVIQAILVMALGVLVFFASGVYAETIYLKDGTILRGVVKSEDEKTLLIESGDTWKRVDKSNIESMSKETVPAEKQAEPKGQAQPSSTAPSQSIVDLRLKFGSAASADKLIEQGSPEMTLSGTDSSNVQIEVNAGLYKDSNVGLILNAGLFSRTHSGMINTATFDYDASGLSLGIGMGIKASDHLHFEGKLELGIGAGNATITAPGFVIGTTEAGGYGSFSVILGAYYTVSRPGFQIGLELGTQSFSGDFTYRDSFGVWNETLEGSSTTANLVVGMRF